MAKRRMKRCSSSLTIRETQIKTTMRYRLAPVRTAVLRRSTNTCWRGCGGKGVGVATMGDSARAPRKIKSGTTCRRGKTAPGRSSVWKPRDWSSCRCVHMGSPVTAQTQCRLRKQPGHPEPTLSRRWPRFPRTESEMAWPASAGDSGEDVAWTRRPFRVELSSLTRLRLCAHVS